MRRAVLVLLGLFFGLMLVPHFVALLGPPSDDSPWKSDLVYVTGPERDSLFAIDSEWLLIDLDEQGRFHRYRIATD